MTIQTLAPARHGRVLTLWTPEDKRFWEQEGEAIARINLWISVPCLFLAFAVWQMWSVIAVNLPVLGYKFTPNQLFWLAALPGAVGGDAAHLLLVPRAGLRRAPLHRDLDGVAADPRRRHRHRHPGSDDELRDVPDARAAVRIRRRQLQLVDGEHQLLLPEGAQGLGARRQRGPRQPRRVGRAVPVADRHRDGVPGTARRRAADDRQGGPAGDDVGAERRVRLGAVDRDRVGARVVLHERHRVGEGVVRRPGGDLQAPAQLDHVLALPGNLRVVHRLRRGIPAADQEPVPGGERAHLRMARPARRRGRASVRRLARRSLGRRARDVLGASSR